MRRIIVLGVLMAVASGSFAAQQAQAPKVVEVEKLKDNLVVLPGAGGGGNTAVVTMNDGGEYAAFNREFLTAVQTAMKTGRPVDEIGARWAMPAKYAGYAAPQAARHKANGQVVYDELQKR